MVTTASIISALENIYISPLETCNLNCRLCYTNKTKNILTNTQILSFIRRYQNYLNNFSLVKGRSDEAERDLHLKSILFCGGEVFTLKSFPRLVNRLLSQNIFISIITNGTIDHLTDINQPQNCQLLVSLDGPRVVHDNNRGCGNFDKTIKFINHALALHFPVEIMYLITPDSYSHLDYFNNYFSTPLKINYITQKTYFYTANHPLSNQLHTTPALTPSQIINIKQNYSSIPPKNFGCFQLTLQSNGRIYGCCESPFPLTTISTPISKTIKEFVKSLTPCTKCSISSLNSRTTNFSKRSHPNGYNEGASIEKIRLSDSISCHGCCAPDFLCGYRNELMLKSCQQVVHKFID